MRSAFLGPVVGCALLAGQAAAGVVRGTVHAPGTGARHDSTLTAAVVYVDSLPESMRRRWVRPSPGLRILQRDRRFLPASIAVSAGTTVRFQNRDQVYHEVFSRSPAKPFDLGQTRPGAVSEVLFDRPGVVNLYCALHPAMAGYVLVLPHRFFARPARGGAFSLPALPPGRYTVRAWHPSLGTAVASVEVPRRGDVFVRLEF